MSRQLSRGSAGEYQADEQAGVALARQGKGFWIQIIEVGAEYKENFTNSTLLSLAFIVYLGESVFRR